jgi:hypothetical protein
VRVQVGNVTVEPGIAGPALERAARAQLYWPLVQRCRDAKGSILPPEVIHLAFLLDGDGYIVTATIVPTAKEERFADASRCMARELAALPFRAPSAGRGTPRHVEIVLPPMD